jgi:hypothetical protein
MIFGLAMDERASWDVDSASAKPFTLLEQLEPRILLSADCLNAIAPEPLDSLLDNMPQVVQHAELLETNDQAEEQAPSDTAIYQPIFTLSSNGESVEAAESATELTEENSTVVVETTVGEFENNETKIVTEDENFPVNIDENLSIQETTSIEIRGPPASDLENYFSNANLEDVALQTQNDILNEYVGGVQSQIAGLSGLYLVEPDVDYFDGQVFYLDFDGAKDVTYNGPVVVEGIDIPEFSAEAGGLDGQEQEIISQILTQLELTFEGSGVTFVITEPDAGTQYSTIYIGGDDSAFADYGSFLGLAEQVDLGNQNPSDNAFVFSENIVSADSDLNAIDAGIADVITHEAWHLLGYRHLETNGNGLLD